ncbi:MAG: hypothetical protein Terrestrivirus4_144 [Terrestrivirus sp.]|uniref:MACPF domain-containing protein n=1 Tax=Terrestrivirus sp. TaxID=2487775 RepID=A0A3G4ZMM5_9VIRU|nr:MAG: hypothetical protein Terrestrivirus4_144 [Terrestrivirus sp.]
MLSKNVYKYIVLIVFFCLNLSTSTLADSIDPHDADPNLPGVNNLRNSYDILTNIPVQNLFVLEYEGDTVCPRGNCYQIPKNINYFERFICDFAGKSFLLETMEEYEEWTSSKVSVKGSFQQFSGSYSSETSTYKQDLFINQEYTSHVVVKCIEYMLNIIPGIRLRDDFIKDAQMLPAVYDNNTAAQYFGLFHFYGSVIPYSMELGGTLDKFSSTKSYYVKTVNQQSVKTQAEASFWLEATGDDSYASKITTEYNHTTNQLNIRSVGGEFWLSGKSDLNGWAASIPKSPAVIQQTMIPISELFTEQWMRGMNVSTKFANVDKALRDYLTISGCTDPRATNYNKEATVSDSSCMTYLTYTGQYKAMGPRGVVEMIDSSEGICFLNGFAHHYTATTGITCVINIGDNNKWRLEAQTAGDMGHTLYCEARCVLIKFTGVPI